MGIWVAQTSDAATFAALLSDRERQALAQHGGLRRQQQTCWGLRRAVLSQRLGPNFRLKRLASGQLICPGGPHLSASHSDAMVAIALHDDAPIGVDVEAVDRAVDGARIAARYLPPAEQEWLKADPARFLPHWTIKEAVLKAMGLGIGGNVGRFVVLGQKMIETPEDWQEPLHWRLRVDRCCDHWVASATTGEPLGAPMVWQS